MKELTRQELKTFRRSLKKPDGNKITQNDFAKLVGVATGRTVGHWEEGVNPIPKMVQRTIRMIMRIENIRNELIFGGNMENEKMMMNPVTGSVDTLDNWEIDKQENPDLWGENDLETLIPVKWDNGSQSWEVDED